MSYNLSAYAGVMHVHYTTVGRGAAKVKIDKPHYIRDDAGKGKESCI